MPEGGVLTIETANRWLDDRTARERDIPPGQYVSLCVSDNGTGMTADVVQRAFDPFFTTKPIGVGTGLGLSMIYGFVRQSGGEVRIYSEVGKGTTVCLYLPRHAAGVAEEEQPAGATSPVARAETTATVLVVDDEPLVRMIVVDVLEELGFTALEAGDGPAHLVEVEQEGAVKQLLGLDVEGHQADAGEADQVAQPLALAPERRRHRDPGLFDIEMGHHRCVQPVANAPLGGKAAFCEMGFDAGHIRLCANARAIAEAVAAEGPSDFDDKQAR